MTETQARQRMQDLLDNKDWREGQCIALGRQLTEKEFRANAENQASQEWEDADTSKY